LTINGSKGENGVEVSPTGLVSITGMALKASYIYTRSGTLTLINSTILGNAAPGGTGAYNEGGTLTLINSTISGYTTAGDGGGAYNNGGALTLINSTVSQNQANSGGGISNNNGGTITLINSTVSQNQADTGGGISNDGGTITLINSTISENMALRPGGGILNGSLSAQIEMIFCTIYGNISRESGGGIWNGVSNIASQLVMRNSIVAGNKAPNGPDILGALTSQGYNLIQNTQDTMFSPNQSHSTDLLEVALPALRVDPLLKDNNGSTQTHALLPGSAAIDRIPPNDCRIKDISTDQRGVRRPQGAACDIGAYELRE
jgi:hypothetical protein